MLNHKLLVYWFWTLDFQSVIVPPSLHFLAWVGLAIWFKCDDKQSQWQSCYRFRKTYYFNTTRWSCSHFQRLYLPTQWRMEADMLKQGGFVLALQQGLLFITVFLFENTEDNFHINTKKITYIEEAVSYAPDKMLYRPLSRFSTHLLTASFSGLQIFTQRMWSKSQSTGLSLWNMRKNSVIIGRSLVRNILPGGHIVCVTFIEHHADHVMILVKFSRNLQQKCSFKVWICSSISDYKWKNKCFVNKMKKADVVR